MADYEGNGDSEQILLSAVEQIQLWYEKKITLDDCVENIRHKNGDHARSVVSILFEYFRHKEFLDTLLLRTASKGTVRPFLKYVALCALTQALFQNSIAAQSAVNIAVDVVKKSKSRAASGFINAVLRNALKAAGNTPLPFVLPPFAAKRWKKTFPDEFAALESLHAENPSGIPFRLRGDALLEENCSFQAVPIPAFSEKFHFYTTEQADELIHSKLFLNGKIYIQDAATSLGASLCVDRIRGTVLDSCAAPGGKTCMLYDLAAPGTKIVAADHSARRIVFMNQNFKRLGIDSNVRCVEMDALNPSGAGFSPESFDLVFADVPCSNTGVARRRPDALCRFDAVRLNEIVKLQKGLLDSLAGLVKKSGCLLYSTCSIEPEEDELQTDSFLERHPDFSRVAEKKLLPAKAHDGAFACLLLRNA